MVNDKNTFRNFNHGSFADITPNLRHSFTLFGSDVLSNLSILRSDKPVPTCFVPPVLKPILQRIKGISFPPTIRLQISNQEEDGYKARYLKGVTILQNVA